MGGAITLFGWAAGIQRLTDWNNEDVSMFANTAAGVLLGGIALIFLCFQERIGRSSSTIARILGFVIATIGGLTIFEHLTNLNLGIDTMLFYRSWGQRASSPPMRMGPPASISFLILGAGLVLATY